MRTPFETMLFRWTLIVFLAATVSGCTAFTKLLDDNSGNTYRRGWADSSSNEVNSPELQSIMSECNYLNTMNKVDALRNTYPSDVRQLLNESYDDFLDRFNDAKKTLELNAKVNKSKADAAEVAVKQCIREKGVTARAGWFNVKTGIFTPDTIQGAQAGVAIITEQTEGVK